MDGYRDELEALRLRAQSLEATLREREAALQARDAQLREAEAKAERNLRTGGMFKDPPPAPKCSSAMMLVMGMSAVLLLIVGIFAAVKGERAEAARRACEGQLSEAEDRIPKLTVAAERARAREDGSTATPNSSRPRPNCGCAPGDLACNMACAVH